MSRLFPLCSGLIVLALIACCFGPPDGLVSPSLQAQGKESTQANWPQFRGPNRDNVSPDKGLLTSWGKAGPKLVWRGSGVGQGFSSVAVEGDKVYTMGDGRGVAYLVALNRATGRKVWESKIGSTSGGGGYPGTRCTPTVDGDRVYALSSAGDLVCAETKGGKILWRKNFRKDYRGSVGGWEYSESPLVDGDRLVCTPGGPMAGIVALDKLTGKELWRSPISDRAEYASMVVSNAGGIKQYVQLTGSGTVGVAAQDGKLLWRFDKLADNTANVPAPIVVENQIFTCAGYGKGGALLTLTADGNGIKMDEVYYNTRLKNKHGGVVLVGEYVYGDTDDQGNPFCAYWKTGEIKWTRSMKRTGTGSGSASLTYADGHLYIRYSNGVVALVPAGGASYQEKGSFKIPNSDTNSWAHPVVIDGKLYLREKDTVWCYNVQAK